MAEICVDMRDWNKESWNISTPKFNPRICYPDQHSAIFVFIVYFLFVILKVLSLLHRAFVIRPREQHQVMVRWAAIAGGDFAQAA